MGIIENTTNLLAVVGVISALLGLFGKAVTDPPQWLFPAVAFVGGQAGAFLFGVYAGTPLTPPAIAGYVILGVLAAATSVGVDTARVQGAKRSVAAQIAGSVDARGLGDPAEVIRAIQEATK